MKKKPWHYPLTATRFDRACTLALIAGIVACGIYHQTVGKYQDEMESAAEAAAEAAAAEAREAEENALLPDDLDIEPDGIPSEEEADERLHGTM